MAKDKPYAKGTPAEKLQALTRMEAFWTVSDWREQGKITYDKLVEQDIVDKTTVKAWEKHIRRLIGYLPKLLEE